MAYTRVRITVYDCRCERCSHEWRSDHIPRACAKCKSPYWDTPRGVLRMGRPPKKSKG